MTEKKSKINELITIKQLPIIEQMLDEMSIEIDNKIQTALKLVPENPDRILAETKKIRAELNKELAELEAARKNVKNEIMKPYLEFESIYKSKISDKYKKADKIFKDKIEECENVIKDKRSSDLKEFFDEYCKAQNVTDITFENMPLKINISGSDKSYREKVKDWIDGVKSDLEVISHARDEQTKFELLLEYKKDFNLKRAILEHEKKERELYALKQREQEQIEEQVAELSTPAVQEGEEIFELTFTVHGTKTQLKALKEYLIANKLI